MTIAVLGGYGDVGQATCRYLLSLGLGPIRIGGRNAEINQVIDDSQVSYQYANFLDESSLNEFVRNCHLVINCAGPSHLIDDRLATVARANNIPYIDVAGDDPLYHTLISTDYQETGHTAVLSAGLQPGLTGLLPLWVAQQIDFDIHHLTSYFVLFDRFTQVAADDYMQGANDKLSTPLAAWRNGRKQPAALQRIQELALPFVPTKMTALPQVSTENERLAKQLSLDSAKWYNCVTGEHVLNAFNTVQSETREQAIETLCRASSLDMAGRSPYIWMMIEAQDSTQQKTHTTVIKGSGNANLTGAIAALTAASLLRGEIPTGVHFCPQALAPHILFPALQQLCAVTVLNQFSQSLEQMLEPELGEI
ncbi:NAD-dependent epimerase/dehydratase family protein [Aliivibrio fischeri]|uniref:Epimerase n=1 Tax=Aliivibrio fischeri TaxID=668 RepID=A0A510ULV4_ALIFS|nr:NAD-dependent epimerase/dehydratase family protein [Aliivibrio fischeri]MUK51034.1 NAD-dependent epimerase/dehydratase family protein [Aliivibrio fischeri]GEK15643.1 epimerase [Aliivibrio fischeri]